VSGPVTRAVILAAGLGLRLRPLTLLRPKPLLPVLDRPILYFWLDRLARAGVGHVAVNAHHLRDQIAAALDGARGIWPRLRLDLSVEPEILGTGGGIRRAAGLLFPDGPPRGQCLYVVNADIFSDLSLQALASDHLSHPGRPATLALVDRPERATVGLDGEGRIVSLREPRPGPGETRRLCGAGIMVMSAFFLGFLSEGFSDVVESLRLWLAQGLPPPGGHLLSGAGWADIGSPPEFLALNRELARGRVLVQDPGPIRGRLSGFVVAEAGARVGEGASVEDSVLLASARVGRGASVSQAIVAGPVPAGARAQGGVWA
jgi:mannose-1-phosphate guanylyltransferase